MNQNDILISTLEELKEDFDNLVSEYKRVENDRRLVIDLSSLKGTITAIIEKRLELLELT